MARVLNSIWVPLLLCGMGLGTVVAQEAAAPELTRLFPAGAPRGATTSIEFKGKYQANSVQVWSSQSGLTWTKAEGENQFKVVVNEEAELGTAFVRLVDVGGASEVFPFVIGQHPELTEVEPNDLSKQPHVISALPVTINGVLQNGGDVDHFQFSLRAGQRLVAFVDAERFIRSVVDATLQLLTTDGHVIVQNLDYRGLDPQVVWVADRDLDVVLRVFGFPAAPDSTISLGGGEKFLYRLSVSTGEVVEAIEPLALMADQPWRYHRRGWNLPTTEATLEASANLAEQEVTLSWPNTLGWLKVPIVRHPSLLAREVRLTENRLANEADARKALSLPCTITGNLQEPRQIDNFVVRAPADKKWRVHLEARDLGYSGDAVVEVLQLNDGQRVHRQDDQGDRLDPEWTWAPTEGVYQFRVFDLHGQSGPQRWYRLTWTEDVPEVKLSVANSSFRGQVGEAIEIPVTIDRSQGYGADLEFGLHGLAVASDAAITLEPSRSLASDDTSKQVTLRVTCASAYSGPVQLRAWASNQPAQPVSVLHKETNLETFWLTAQTRSTE
ncbi:MAG: hypothetical protein JNL67_22420 [Planctomycetaceae bacterium]|nr:hypothetical protein [Planctomycetaceae bacterium]